MFELNTLIDAHTLEMTCWQCGFVESHTFHWLCKQRDSKCAVCEAVIVLDSTKTQRAIARRRSALAQLHWQMTSMLSAALNRMQHVQSRSHGDRRKLPRLALSLRHPSRLHKALRNRF
jgi:hypothetical protein